MTCQYQQELFGQTVRCEKKAEFEVTTTLQHPNGKTSEETTAYCKSHKESITSHRAIPVKHKIKELYE